MAGISWNSSSMNSFLNASLNLNTSGTNSIFSTVGDSKLIKSGTYKKLMKSYFDTVDTDSAKKNSSTTDKSSSSSSSSSASKSRHACTYAYDPNKSTISTVKNNVLDKLLDKTEKKSTVSNSVLDELLNKNKDTTATEDGTVTDKAGTGAGAVIDESV
ncbi:MAG: hypothetical protein K2P35_06895 [Lachnospiraceae bacterium]|nr:hypothetical protein [Lachnospiraceae bacterium]